MKKSNLFYAYKKKKKKSFIVDFEIQKKKIITIN